MKRVFGYFARISGALLTRSTTPFLFERIPTKVTTGSSGEMWKSVFLGCSSRGAAISGSPVCSTLILEDAI